MHRHKPTRLELKPEDREEYLEVQKAKPQLEQASIESATSSTDVTQREDANAEKHARIGLAQPR